MAKEASWVAAMLAALVILMAVVSPPGTRQSLPMLKALDRPPASIVRAPLIGSILGHMQRQVVVLTWELERIPAE